MPRHEVRARFLCPEQAIAPSSRLTSLLFVDRPTEGAKIFAPEDTTTPIGTVTSGIPSPSLKQNIAMGYVATGAGLNKKGSEVLVEVRGKMRKAQVVGMPWIKPGYYRGE